ncbi:auxin-responsive protein IAA21-like [Dendrobium catenatum]|uniref:Auxin-responsive protein n=1 Tax=Dendrobium catenatum TaxID=906689 RepID=A0A2I0XHI4_9ASPA|nr:auxin-responsive protein IAA21-like [Dendrobium catenatum]PKU87376.1 Auxin-responsive protein IAA27 [Dendrobium catenatum]
MAPPLEHDYIGLSEVSDKLASGEVENLRETELRLGLPGSLSPERKEKVGLTLGLQLQKGFAAGAKRGFSDAIDGNGKWVFSGIGGSEGEMEKGGVLFSPRGGGGVGGQTAGAGKEVAGKAVGGQDKKAQGMPAAKAQVVGWPPIRSYRKNTMSTNPSKNKEDGDGKIGLGCLYVKVSMDGAPYLRKVDLRTYGSYKELSSALEKMFSGFTIGQCGAHGTPSRDGLTESCLMDLLNGSEYVLTYEDKDGDWMLVGDVPWKMFIDSCKRLRIMKGSDAIGLAPKAMEKNKNRN